MQARQCKSFSVDKREDSTYVLKLLAWMSWRAVIPCDWVRDHMVFFDSKQEQGQIIREASSYLPEFSKSTVAKIDSCGLWVRVLLCTDGLIFIKFVYLVSGQLLRRASLVAQTVQRLPAMQETWVRKIPWRRKWQPTPVLLPGKFHGLRGSSEPGRLQSMGSQRVRHD